MEKTSTSKSLPKGYTEIAAFIEEIHQEAFQQNLEEQSFLAKIDNFLEKIYSKRCSVIPALIQILVESSEIDTKTSIIALVLSRCDANKSTNNIVSTLQSANLPDNISRKLLLILEKHGDLTSLIESVKYIHDKNRLAEESLQVLLDCIGPSGEEKNNLFHHLANQDVGFYRLLAANLMYRSDEQSIWLLGSLSQFPDDKVAETAIRALGESRNLLAYEMLDTLITNGKQQEELRKKTLANLAASGVSKASPKPFIPHKCYLSWFDSNGNRILLMSQRSGTRSRLNMVTFMLNEDKGIQDSSAWPELSSFEMESLIKGLESEVGLRQIDYDKGVRALEDALWVAAQHKKILAPNFLSVRRILGSLKLTPRPYAIDPRLLELENIKERLAILLQDSAKLSQLTPFSQWELDQRASLAFLKEKKSVLDGPKLRKTVLTQFIKAVIEPKRDIWKRRFLLVADFLYTISPRSYRDQIEICLAIYLALEKGGQAAAIPFMVNMAERTIEKFRQKLGAIAVE